MAATATVAASVTTRNGELIDQCIHLIDLAGWFLGPFTSIEGHAATYFWKMPVDDNAFINLRNQEGKTAWLQASCTEWKNHFSFEIYGRDGKLRIEGLGGSYGVERLSYYNNGIERRLTDVHGQVIGEVLA